MNEENKSYLLRDNQILPVSAFSGDCTVEFRFEVLQAETYRLGLLLENTGDGKPLRFCTTHEGLLLLVHGKEKFLMRAFPGLHQKEPNTLRLDIYPGRRLVRYHVNGGFYGERELAHPTDPVLTGGKVSLFIEGKAEIRVTDVSCREAAPPHRAYTLPTPPSEPTAFDTLFPRSVRPGQEVYLLNAGELSLEEYMTALTLQGLVNRRVPRLYVHTGRYNGRGMEGYSTRWYTLLEEKGRTLTPCTLNEALERFSDCYQGLILGELRPAGETSFQMNLITMLAGVEDRIYVSRERAAEMDARLDRLDIDGRWTSDVEAYRWAKENLWPRCHQGILCHMYGDCDLHFTEPSRDYLVQHKIFVFNSSGVKTEDDYYFYFDLLALTPPNTPVLGIACRNGESIHDGVLDEDALFRACAELGKFFVYTFSVDNMSVLSGLETGELRQKPCPPVALDRQKAYVSFLLSEGENYAWAYHLWGENYWHPSREGVGKAWSTAGAMLFLAPAVLEWYYENASPWDAWYLDGNGIGDMYNPDIYALRLPEAPRKPAFDDYLRLTREMMRRADLSVIRLFDATYSVTDDSVRAYIKAIPEIQAVFTGYNSEPDMERFPASEYLLDGVPVFRTRVVSQTPTYAPEKDGQVLLDGILREIEKDGRPAFINVFVLGNYMLENGSMVLQYVQEHLPEGCAVLRPEQLAAVFREYCSEGGR